MEQLMQIKEQLIAQVQNQMGNLEKVHTKELGEVIDMIKDLAETEYYCSVTEAMDTAKDNEEKRNTYYYMEKYLPYYPYNSHEEDYRKGRMYYGGDRSNQSQNNSQTGGRTYYEEYYPMTMHDSREGRSGSYRKMYMESKETHQDSMKKLQDLEAYMKELTSDIMEMIQDASPEEKAVLQKKVSTLSNKLQNV